MLRVEGLSRHFGGVYAVRDVSLDVGQRRAPRDHRPERRRQIHALSPDQRASAPGRRQSRLPRRPDRNAAPARAGASGSCDRLSGSAHLSRDDRARERDGRRACADRATASSKRRSGCRATAGRSARSARARTQPSIGSACRTGRTARPTYCRSGSRGRCRSPAPCAPARPFSCSTSPPRACASAERDQLGPADRRAAPRQGSR